MKSAKKKKSGGQKYDYKKIASQTKGQARASSKRKGGSGGNIFKSEVKFTKFSPAKDEDHSADIIPFQAGKDMPIDPESKKRMTKVGDWAYSFEYWQHAGIGPLENERVICCEKTWMEPCPICENRRELISEKAFDDKKMSNLYAKRRNLYNVVCYDSDKEEEKGVQLFDVSHFYFEKHISKLAAKAVRRKRGSKLKVADPFKNFADPSEDGVSIEWSIEGATKSKNDFDTWMGHQLVEREYALDEKLLDSALQLDQIVEHLSYAELYKKYYDEVYEGEGEDGAEEEEEEIEDGAEEEEEEIEDGAEEEEEEIEDDDLDGLDRKELKQILKDEEIDFKVFKSTEDDDIRAAIRDDRGNDGPEEEEEEEAPKVKSRKKGKTAKPASKKKAGKAVCPAGGTLGANFEDYDECDDCKLWNPCDDKYQAEYVDED